MFPKYIFDIVYNSSSSGELISDPKYVAAHSFLPLASHLGPELVTPGVDLPGQGEGADVCVAQVHPLQLHHHLHIRLSLHGNTTGPIRFPLIGIC